jgi:hypothetical protein
MSSTIDWDQLDPLAMIGGPTGGLSDDVTHGGMGSAGILPQHPAFHPAHPFFWFAVIAGVTFGAIGASTHLRVGPFKAGLDAGKE